jgi:hypothetical protein
LRSQDAAAQLKKVVQDYPDGYGATCELGFAESDVQDQDQDQDQGREGSAGWEGGRGAATATAPPAATAAAAAAKDMICKLKSSPFGSGTDECRAHRCRLW